MRFSIDLCQKTEAHEYTIGEFNVYCLTEGVDLEKQEREQMKLKHIENQNF